jgi:hypothetical protein
MDWGVAWSLVSGLDAARTDAALDALRPLLRRLCERPFAAAGLFSRLQSSRGGPLRPISMCELCDDPDCEHLGVARRR